MSANVDELLERIKRERVPELRARYRELFGVEATSHNRLYLMRRVAWKVQADAYGGLSERARKRAEEIADFADLRTTPPRPRKTSEMPLPAGRSEVRPLPSLGDRRLPMPGTVLTREYQGRLVTATVLEDGFGHDGRTYRSLSAIAREVTGTSWNGFDFFHLGLKRSTR
jgi:hypothetical protein